MPRRIAQTLCLIQMENNLDFKEEPLPIDTVNLIADTYSALLDDFVQVTGNERESFSASHLDQLLPFYKKGIRFSKNRRKQAVLFWGIGLGQLLVDKLGFQWVSFEDADGRELAVRHNKSNWRAFPLASVRKRIRTKETGYFSAIFDSFKEAINEENEA